MVLDGHSIWKVDIDVPVHILDQNVAVVVSVASHFLLRRERGVGVLQVRVRSLVEGLPQKMLIILIFLNLLTALVLLVLISHGHDPAEFGLLSTELVPFGGQAFPLPGRKLLVNDLLQMSNLPGRVIRQSSIVQLLGKISIFSTFLHDKLFLYDCGRLHKVLLLTRHITVNLSAVFLTYLNLADQIEFLDGSTVKINLSSILLFGVLLVDFWFIVLDVGGWVLS